jgi:hypothetical protein
MYQMYGIDKDDPDFIELDWSIILISLGFAGAHAILEIIFLLFEANALEQTLMHYSIVCYNARAGWLPFNHQFSPLALQEDEP